MKQHERWVLVANASSARIFRLEGMTKLVELKAFIHPEAHLHEQDLTSSKPGRAFDSHGQARHQIDPKTTQKDHEKQLFAKTLSEYLDHARENNDFSQLYLLAAPSFLGILRQTLSSHTQELISKEFDKDVVHMSTHEILEHIKI